MTNEATILDALRRRNAPGTEFRLSRTIPGFLEGELVVVDIMQDSKAIGENYYYDSDSPAESRSFKSMDELVLWLGQRKPDGQRVGGAFSALSRFEVVSAVIAILITLAICFIILSNVIYHGKSGQLQIEIPDILSNALTIILGFYFGSQVGKSSAGAHPSPRMRNDSDPEVP